MSERSPGEPSGVHAAPASEQAAARPLPGALSSLPLPDNAAALVDEKPEILVGGVFVGGLILGQILRRLGS